MMTLAEKFEKDWQNILKKNNNDWGFAMKEIDAESIDADDDKLNTGGTVIYYFEDDSLLAFEGEESRPPKAVKYLSTDEANILSNVRIRTSISDDNAESEMAEIETLLEKTGWRASFTGSVNEDEWDIDVEKI